MRQTILAAMGVAALLVAPNQTRAAEIPDELTAPNYRTREITGIGPQAGVQRQDPSNVIKVDRVHTGCGPYDPDAFTDTDRGRGISWGVAQHAERGKPLHIIRFDVDLHVPAQ